MRVLIGESTDAPNDIVQTETLYLLETNLDDVSGEMIGYCTAQLLEAGALDVFTCGIQMKKNRPGVLLSVLCEPAESERLETIIFRETTTLGVRRSTVSRRKLPSRAASSPNDVGTHRRHRGDVAQWRKTLFAGIRSLSKNRRSEKTAARRRCRSGAEIVSN